MIEKCPKPKWIGKICNQTELSVKKNAIKKSRLNVLAKRASEERVRKKEGARELYDPIELRIMIS